MGEVIKYITGMDSLAYDFYTSFPKELFSIIKLFSRHKTEIYIIGGAVRDFLIGGSIGDYDLATSTTPDIIIKWLNEVNIKTKSIGGDYGTVLAIIGKKAFDISTFRAEHFSTPGKPPKVEFVDSLRIDLARRDFTINAIVFDPIRKKFLDPFDGIGDIGKKRIRIIGDPHIRLREDGLRIIRLIRFSSQFGLEIDELTLTAIKDIGNLAKFRSGISLRIELFKLLKVRDPSEGLILLWKSNVIKAIFPNFPLIKFSDYSDAIKSGLKRFNEIPEENTIVRLFGLLILLIDHHSQSDESWQAVSDYLNLTKKEHQTLLRLYHSWLNFPIKFNQNVLKRWIRTVGINTSEALLPLIFLEAEIREDKKNENLVKQRRIFMEEASKILNNFRKNPGHY